MLVDHFTYGVSPAQVAGEVTTLEQAGVDGWFVAEASRDPTIPATLAAEHTERMTVGTGIAVAFARTPMTIAYLAHGLQEIADGRFVLGIGSQVRPHIERRFAMPFAPPVARMREYMTAYHAIWDAWETAEPLAFEGEFYRHTLMPPAFRPPIKEFGRPPIHLAAVGPQMCRLAGQVADGLICHPLSGARYIEHVTLPAVHEAARAAGRDPGDVTISAPVLVATGHSDEEVAADTATARQRIAFYASTPAYRPVLELYGWGELHDTARALTREGRWDELPDLVDDVVLDTFAIRGAPDEVGTKVATRYGGVLDRVNLSTNHRFSPEEWHLTLKQLHAA